MSRITALIVVQVVTIAVGFGALGYAVYASGQDKMTARRDTCQLIVGLARAAAGTSKTALAQANAYIDRTQLRNCNAYAQHPSAKPIKRSSK